MTGNDTAITVFMCGDVMTGRGIDQILPHPVAPRIHEPFMTSARGYVWLAEEASGSIPAPADFGYVWDDALEAFERLRPDVRLINLETSVTTHDGYWRGKGINYRMSPDNFPAITAAGIDVCVLANNHVIDWGYRQPRQHPTLPGQLRSVLLRRPSVSCSPAIFSLPQGFAAHLDGCAPASRLISPRGADTVSSPYHPPPSRCGPPRSSGKRPTAWSPQVPWRGKAG